MVWLEPRRNLKESRRACRIIYRLRAEYCDGFMVKIPEMMRWMNCSSGFRGWEILKPGSRAEIIMAVIPGNQWKCPLRGYHRF